VSTHALFQASLLGTAPAYFKYLLERRQDTCLAKILGVYQACTVGCVPRQSP
jgi:hypothetical protein